MGIFEMTILIANVQIPFTRGGAEFLAEGLLKALRADGHLAEIVTVPFKWYPAEIVPHQMLACGLLDISEFNGRRVDKLIGLKFPAYLIPHASKTMWLVHQHRQAYDLWGTPHGLNTQAMGSPVRDLIRQADARVFSETAPVYTISKTISRRLLDYCGVESEALYNPPAGAELFFTADAGDYFFYPSRLDSLKRQTLVLEALAKTRHPVQVRFAGISSTPDYESATHKLAQRLGVETRVEWMGKITEEEKRNLYAHAIGVLFPPVDEDYGYVTLEAMLAAKPVITCTDSGGPLEFVAHETSGLITAPEPAALAEAMDRLWENRNIAKKLGAAGRERYQELDISWKNVVDRLLA